MKTNIALLVPLLLVSTMASLAGCATYRPIIDSQSISSPAKYEVDLAECQAYARQINPAAGAVAGLVFGALLGAAMGTVIGDSSGWAEYGARSGAVQGGVGAAAEGAQTQMQIIRTCLHNRGYSVLN